jgi:hypothetical protein
MGKELTEINPELAEWIGRQHLFFVATAASSGGHINCSPKGGDSFRILSPRAVAYLDYTGSGAETAAHLRENGRIVIMFCGFEGAPRILRLHGQGEVVEPSHTEFARLASAFPSHIALRAFVRVSIERVSTSCGYAVPFFEYGGNRGTLDKWAAAKGPAGLSAYRKLKNRTSIDGLPALNAE